MSDTVCAGQVGSVLTLHGMVHHTAHSWLLGWEGPLLMLLTLAIPSIALQLATMLAALPMVSCFLAGVKRCVKVSAFPYDPSESADKGIEEAVEGFNKAASNPPLKNLAAADPATGIQTTLFWHCLCASIILAVLCTCTRHRLCTCTRH
jgi:hypothetical protein